MKRLVGYISEVVKFGAQVAFETLIGTVIGIAAFAVTIAIAAAIIFFILANVIK